MYNPPKTSARLAAPPVFDAVGLAAPALDGELAVVGDVAFGDVVGLLVAEPPVVVAEPVGAGVEVVAIPEPEAPL
jgi:hypothetical protein